MISAIHSGIEALFRVVWSPLTPLPPWAQLTVFSALFGVVMVLLYGRVSNQDAIRRVKDDITAALLEVVLFRRDIRVSLRAQAELFLSGLRYFLLALGPVLILALPFALILGHVNLRLGARPLALGEQGILAVTAKSGGTLRELQVKGSENLEVVGPVRVPKASAAYWRLTPKGDGAQSFELAVGTSSLAGELHSGAPSGTPAAGIFLTRTDWLTQILFPNEGPTQTLPSGLLSSVELTYPQREYSLFGFGMSWVTAFFVLSIIAGYLGSRVFKISV